MRQIIPLVAVAAFVASACALYVIKYDTARVGTEVTDLTGKVAAREAEIALLRAEKANLLRPARIDRLVKAHLTLRPTMPKQLGRIADLPWRGEAPGSVADGPPVAPQP